jgi:hypothetical protein
MHEIDFLHMNEGAARRPPIFDFQNARMTTAEQALCFNQTLCNPCRFSRLNRI